MNTITGNTLLLNTISGVICGCTPSVGSSVSVQHLWLNNISGNYCVCTPSQEIICCCTPSVSDHLWLYTISVSLYITGNPLLMDTITSCHHHLSLSENIWYIPPSTGTNLNSQSFTWFSCSCPSLLEGLFIAYDYKGASVATQYHL